MGWFCSRWFLAGWIVLASINSYSQIVFEKRKLRIGKHALYVEVADTPKKRKIGLMNRKKLPVNAGMLFIFSKESKQVFWMKDTFIDLSIGFFNKKRVLIDIQHIDGLKSLVQKEIPRVVSRSPARFALEVNRGWFQKNQIKLGQKFSLN